jgi:hypothetical protein
VDHTLLARPRGDANILLAYKNGRIGFRHPESDAPEVDNTSQTL